MADGEKIIAVNRKAHFNYEILEKIEAGLVLVGTEVKSLREGKANLSDAYVSFRQGEAYLLQAQIQPYSHAGHSNHEPKRERKLLLHQPQIAELAGQIQQKGFTLIPIRLYFKAGKAKVELALGRGKKMHDKRESIKKRETDREIAKTLKQRRGE